MTCREIVQNKEDADTTIVLLFVKAPFRGKVKSRLALSIGPDAALDLYKNFVLDVVEMLGETGFPFRICYDPPEAGAFIAEWLGAGRQYMPQQGTDLGERMAHAFDRAFSQGFSRAVLIGSDIPDLSGWIIREAFGSLEKNQVSLGPAADGGYYLIGFNRESFLPDLFHGIPWSTRSVFRKTMNILKTRSISVHQTPEWEDVDSLTGLKALFTRNEHSAFRTSRTMTYLNRYAKKLFREYGKSEECGRGRDRTK